MVDKVMVETILVCNTNQYENKGVSMNNGNMDIQQAISDIALLRQVLHKTEQEQIDSRLAGITLDANLLSRCAPYSSRWVSC